QQPEEGASDRYRGHWLRSCTHALSMRTGVRSCAPALSSKLTSPQVDAAATDIPDKSSWLRSSRICAGYGRNQTLRKPDEGLHGAASTLVRRCVLLLPLFALH